MSDRWSCLGLTLYPLGDGTELATSDFSGASLVVSAEEADALFACRELKPIEEHAGAIVAKAAAAGVLFSERAFLERIRSRPRPAPPAPSALGIVTRDRPDELARCLRSFRAPEIVVCDDGSGSAPPGARYAGPAEKAAFLDALSAESGVPRAVAAFGLGDVGLSGFRAGGNRNALFLDLAGRVFVSVDDDVVGRFARPSSPPRPPLLSEDLQPETRVFPDREAALAAAPAMEVDFLAEHGALLGRDPGSFPGLELGEIGPGLALRARAGAFVAATMTGILGDCAVGNASWMLSPAPSERAALGEVEDDWARAKASRELLRVSRRPLLTDQMSLMAYACGYDGRAPLPPFPPFGRNEDAVFAFLLTRCVPGALIGHLPLALLHAPAGTRGYGFSAGGRVGFGDVLVTCMASLEPSPGEASAEERYRDLGRHLRDLAELPEADFQEVLRRLLWHRASARLDRLCAERETAAGCASRKTELLRAIEGIQGSLLAPDFAVPVDVPGPDLAAQRAASRALLGRYGELLEAWPAIVAGARRLHEAGRRLSR